MNFLNWLTDLLARIFSALTPPKQLPPEPEPPAAAPKPEAAPLTYAAYEAKYYAAKVRPEHLPYLKAHCGKILAYAGEYTKVEKATGVPWYLVACLHSLEGSLNFSTHLHNGDPLSARTVHVPAGRPLAGKPPFAWYESAIDALGGVGAHKTKNWTLGYCLAYAETFNGLGYRKRGVPSPYLWSFTDQYSRGKYVADGKYDANAISKQAGVAALLKVLGIFSEPMKTLT